jgi:CSLREA domain-containing protein
MDRREGAGRIRRATLVSILATLALLSVFASSASARTFTVTRADDPVPSACQRNDCSLREAVIAANAQAGADTIQFAPAVSGNAIVLAHGELSIGRPVTISGPGASKLSVSGNGLSRVFHVRSGHVTIRGIAIQDGRETATPTGPACPATSAPAFTLGGGILEDKGHLKLDRVKVRNNTVTTALGGIIGGGGIANIDGTLEVKRGRVTQNTVEGGGITGGGGILNCVGIVKLTRTTVANSSVSGASIDVGGGIANGLGAAHNTGQLTLNKSTIEGNDVSSDAIPGGGGLSTSGGPVTVMNSTISDNSTTATGSGVLSDDGGVEISNAIATFTNSTIANNLASGKNAAGGGILTGGSGEKLLLHSVTLAGNIADGTSSRGGNLESSESAHVLNSIVAKGKAATGSNCDGAVKSSGHDLENEDTCGFNGKGDRVNKKPKIRDLAQNGGPTETIALKRTSPAIDHAAKKTSPKRDQRGFKRVGKPDIGAYEFGAKP